MMKYAQSCFQKKKKDLARGPLAIDQWEESCPFIPLHQIRKATNDFDEAAVIGKGGHGKVYKGNLDDGATTTVVAIKRLKAGIEEFWAEIRLLPKLRHTNLISLIGYCNENQEMILVYEYTFQGNLAHHLYKTSRKGSWGGSRSPLTWEERLKICHGAALGLDYLHNGGFVHQDVKSKNILLDQDAKGKYILFDKYLVAKVSDLGLAKSEPGRTTRNTSFFSAKLSTRKSDVYSFGVMLLEVLCARPLLGGRIKIAQIWLTHWAEMNIKRGKLERIIDPSLNGDTTPDSLKYFAELAIQCMHKQSEERPTMAQVVERLKTELVLHQRKGKSQSIAEFCNWHTGKVGGKPAPRFGNWEPEDFPRDTGSHSHCLFQGVRRHGPVEQVGPEVINATITLDDIRRLSGRMNRKDAAAHLGISVSTFKRRCREYGIKRWPHTIKKEVRSPPDQQGERNTSAAGEAPSHILEIGEEGEPADQNQEANVFRPDFTEGPFAWTPENSLITGSSSEWACQVIDQSTLSVPHPNQDALVFPEIEIDWRNSLTSQAEFFPDIHISGSSTLTFPTCSDQAPPSQSVQVHSMQYTVYPDDNALVFPHNEIVSLQEPFPERHVFNHINGNEHTNIVTIKAFYGDTVLKFLFPFASGIVDLKNEVSKRLNVAVDRFEVKYKDKYEDLISIPCNEDWRLYLWSSLEDEEIRVFVLDKVGGNPNS